MERDGHDVSGAAAELVALVNYVTSSQLSMRELQTHRISAQCSSDSI